MQQLISLLPQIKFIIIGVETTVSYSLTAVFCGLMIGICLAIFKTSKNSLLRIFAQSYTSIFRGTPLLIQLIIIYFGIPSLTGIKLSIFVAGVLSFSLNSGAYISEIIRAGINSIDQGQFEAARVLGISRFLCMRDIILPQATRIMFPSLINELINMIKESALISTIGGMDLMRRAHIASTENYDFFTPMIIAAATYYVLIMIVSNIGKFLEKRLKV